MSARLRPGHSSIPGVCPSARFPRGVRVGRERSSCRVFAATHRRRHEPGPDCRVAGYGGHERAGHGRPVPTPDKLAGLSPVTARNQAVWGGEDGTGQGFGHRCSGHGRRPHGLRALRAGHSDGGTDGRRGHDSADGQAKEGYGTGSNPVIAHTDRIEGGHSPSLNTGRHTRMSQAPTLTTEHKDLTETALDRWMAAIADGQVCDVEMAEMTLLITTVDHHAGIVDMAVLTGLSVIRRGVEAQRPSRLLVELADLQNQAA